MSDGGKGSVPRPLGVPHFNYADNWDRTFGNRAVNDPTDGWEPTPTQVEETLRYEIDGLIEKLVYYREECARLQSIVDQWKEPPVACRCCGTTEGLHADLGSGGPWRCGSPDCAVF